MKISTLKAILLSLVLASCQQGINQDNSSSEPEPHPMTKIINQDMAQIDREIAELDEIIKKLEKELEDKQDNN